MAKFFITCPINFEKLCAQELQIKWSYHFSAPLPEISYVTGGFEIECELENGLALNHILKTASRILLRLKEQKCRDIPKLFNIIRKFNWKTYLKKEEVSWHISTQKSRLINTKKMQGACEDGLKSFFQANALSNKIKACSDYQIQNIFIRVDQDHLTLSLDTSGELLHIRGNRSFRGHASIRENIASALLIHLMMPNMQGRFSLLDPMCGTGTFLSEAHDFFIPSNPSKRKFAYFDWHLPCSFERAQNDWHLKLFGRDIDDKILNKLDLPFASFRACNAFDTLSESAEELGVIDFLICNPPYGKRIKLDRPAKKYYHDLTLSLLKKYSPQKLGILIPSANAFKIDTLKSIKVIKPSQTKEEVSEYKIASILPFSNNGIRIQFVVLEKAK